jgi:hypothetical protein
MVKESRPALFKASVVVGAANGLRDHALYRYNGQGIYYGQNKRRKKNFKGFPMFFTFENFKRAFLGDVK